ncbi:MAG: hypothetical protein JW941_10175 [Candidatus Coatesbacteria bacterium]|nr:hypothetical protein [Candidatus Coatesbacteria bacterium]
MTTKITRNVILDLLPLYQAGEASEDTRMLVEEYLETDADLAEIARKDVAERLLEQTPVPLTKEDEMEAYEEAKHQIYKRIITLATIIAVGFMAIAGTALFAVMFLMSR